MFNAVLHLFLLKGWAGSKDILYSCCFTLPCRPCRGRCRLHFPEEKPGEREGERTGNLEHEKTLGDAGDDQTKLDQICVKKNILLKSRNKQANFVVPSRKQDPIEEST